MEKYNYKFELVGGQTRVIVDTGHDLVNLSSLDRKLWTVLSCPSSGLEIDQRTLDVLNSDGDDRVRVNEVMAASDWLKAVLKNPEILCEAKAECPVAAIDAESAEGAAVLAEAAAALPGKDTLKLSDIADVAAAPLLEKLLLLCRDFRTFARNYVTLYEFYGGEKAIFQAGTLFIDQRSCDLCLKVTDMEKHDLSASLSGMYLLYCNCTVPGAEEPMPIVAAVTAGEVNDLREGMNGVFFDRAGVPWDATVTKIVDNPISVRQAFWSPYRKLGRFISDKIGKRAAEREAAANDKLLQSADAATNKPADAAKTDNKSTFDIAKFAGIFAAIGMAVGYLTKALVDIAQGIAAAKWWEIILVIVIIMLLISGPSMFMAWLKLRKRNFAPVLNANGWAINSRILISVFFGVTLTGLPDLPLIQLPKAHKKLSPAATIAIIVAALAVVFCVLYFTNCLAGIGLPFAK